MSHNPFWQYSVTRYAQNPIAQTCLQWQAQFNTNTNLVLLADWLGAQRILIDDAQWRIINEQVLPWQTRVVLPLRTMRVDLKKSLKNKNSEVLRVQIKSNELLAEQIMQNELYEYCLAQIDFNHISDQLKNDVIKANIACYLRACCGVNHVDDEALAVFM